MQPALGISRCACLSALHRSDVRIIIVGMRAGVKSKNEFGELGKSNQGSEEGELCAAHLSFLVACLSHRFFARNFFWRDGFGSSWGSSVFLCGAKRACCPFEQTEWPTETVCSVVIIKAVVHVRSAASSARVVIRRDPSRVSRSWGKVNDTENTNVFGQRRIRGRSSLTILCRRATENGADHPGQLRIRPKHRDANSGNRGVVHSCFADRADRTAGDDSDLFRERGCASWKRRYDENQ